MTPLSTLVYRSKATIPLTELELLYLLGQARGRNQAIPIRLFRDWHMQLAFREGYWGSAIDGLVQAPNDVLDQLHEQPQRAPAILAEFTALGGGPFARTLR
ncbi:MAG: hypothetical protein EBV72_13625 [Betaproteobacteria bacterium]|nr:hypothetical protein [Betaproteobacteria bacterium]